MQYKNIIIRNIKMNIIFEKKTYDKKYKYKNNIRKENIKIKPDIRRKNINCYSK